MNVRDLYLSERSSIIPISWRSGEIEIEHFHWTFSDISMQGSPESLTSSIWKVKEMDVIPSKFNLTGSVAFYLLIPETIDKIEVVGEGELHIEAVTLPASLYHLSMNSSCFLGGTITVDEVHWFSGTLGFDDESEIIIQNLFIYQGDAEKVRNTRTYFSSSKSCHLEMERKSKCRLCSLHSYL